MIMVMGIKNKDKNYLEVVETLGGKVTVHIYKDKKTFKNGIDPLFGKVKVCTFDCSLELKKEKGNEKDKDKLIKICEKIIKKQSKKDKNKHKPKNINGEWSSN